MAHVLSILQSHGTMDARSKPTFFPLRTPLSFDNMLVCLVWPSLLVCHFACFLSSCFLVCLLVSCFFCHCMCTLGARMLGARMQILRCKLKGQMQARRHKPKKGNVQQIGGLASLSGSSLSLSLFLQNLVLGFLSLYLALGRIPRVWQCLLYISCTLLGHTLWMQACHFIFFVPCLGYIPWVWQCLMSALLSHFACQQYAIGVCAVQQGPFFCQIYYRTDRDQFFIIGTDAHHLGSIFQSIMVRFFAVGLVGLVGLKYFKKKNRFFLIVIKLGFQAQYQYINLLKISSK